MNKENKSTDWSLYHQHDKKHRLSEISNILYQKQPGFLIDLGCGSGADAAFFLSKGWTVLGVDIDTRYALNKRKSLAAEEANRFQIIENRIEDFSFPKADIIYSFDALYFCNPSEFPCILNKIYAALHNEGFFIGTMLGDKDHIVVCGIDIIFYSKQEFLSLFQKKYRVLFFREVYQDRLQTNLQTGKHSLVKKHIFYFILQKN